MIDLLRSSARRASPHPLDSHADANEEHPAESDGSRHVSSRLGAEPGAQREAMGELGRLVSTQLHGSVPVKLRPCDIGVRETGLDPHSQVDLCLDPTQSSLAEMHTPSAIEESIAKHRDDFIVNRRGFGDFDGRWKRVRAAQLDGQILTIRAWPRLENRE